jgi:hypothetical protein
MITMEGLRSYSLLLSDSRRDDLASKETCCCYISIMIGFLKTHALIWPEPMIAVF